MAPMPPLDPPVISSLNPIHETVHPIKASVIFLLLYLDINGLQKMPVRTSGTLILVSKKWMVSTAPLQLDKPHPKIPTPISTTTIWLHMLCCSAIGSMKMLLKDSQEDLLSILVSGWRWNDSPFYTRIHLFLLLHQELVTKVHFYQRILILADIEAKKLHTSQERRWQWNAHKFIYDFYSRSRSWKSTHQRKGSIQGS